MTNKLELTERIDQWYNELKKDLARKESSKANQCICADLIMMKVFINKLEEQTTKRI